MIVDPSRPLLDGGIGPGGGSSYMMHNLGYLAVAQGINLERPYSSLPKKSQAILMEGAGGKPGILGILDKMYKDEIASEAYHDWFMQYMSPAKCPACNGQRLKPASLAVKIQGSTIGQLTALSVEAALRTVRAWKLKDRELQIGGRAVEEVRNRLEFLSAVGLEYLSLERSAVRLSGGEAQRIRLATQIGSKLRGVLYVLDEPSIGLHARDNDRLVEFADASARSRQYRPGGGARCRYH